jgi:hypothetical protein
MIEELRNDSQPYSKKRIEEVFKTESKASQLMNPYIIIPLVRLILTHDPTIIEPIADRLVSILISVNCLFIGNYKLKEQTWELLVAVLEWVRARLNEIPDRVITSLLTLKVT